MSIHIALNHVTHYRYDRLVGLSPQLVRLRPAPHCRTRILSYSLRVDPPGHFVNWQQDPQSNYVARLTFPEKVRELRIEVDLVAEMAVYNPFDFFLEPEAEHTPIAYPDWQLRELQPYLHKEPLTPLFTTYLAAVPTTPQRTIDFLVALNRSLANDISYVIRLETGVQPTEVTLEKRSGSCRDSTWLLVQLLRHLGFASRFVSGYLIQTAPDVKALDGPSGPERDFTDLHAWCEVYLPGAGWVGLDPTSGLMAGEGHIPLSCTPEPSSAAPVTGGVDDCKVEFEHHMEVRRVYESPRVTKPYTDAQWAAVAAMGHHVDERLRADDVRLTMGGEPTFVALGDPDGAEWNTEAMGPTKRLLAADLLWRMREHYGKNGFVHFGQGKWYPGEQLPRWALSCYWRRDGEPAWKDRALFADERRNYGVGPEQAQAFLRGMAARLGVSDEHVLPGFEDVWYYMWRERRLPANVDPFESHVDDEMERARLKKVFSSGLKTTVGYAMPLTRRRGAWQTGRWFLRDERMYLMPGDSAMGYRLPLDSLPWVTAADYPYLREFDPFDPRLPLPPYDALRERLAPLQQSPGTAPTDTALGEAATGEGSGVGQPGRPGSPGQPGQPAGSTGPGESVLAGTDSAGVLSAGRATATAGGRPPARGESAPETVRTALCAQARGGVLYVFVPPLPTVDDYLQLVAAAEATAEALGTPVLLEGYPPPSDPRLVSFQITPDPGVIEVNIQPASCWDDLSAQTTTLYDEAHQTRLTTEKFMIDGRHVGTGGGNHFVLGGETPADSPFLRRPDLLRSLVSYWHNHPSLSYLLSGLFIGPTSQAPRVDEARHDSVYELEVAFEQLRERGHRDGYAPPPWLVDRIFRHLLADMTGNTHRAEFCIDKLYSPDSLAGRRGLLEMRAFEMPPHARMSLAQQLLIRALVARFWREPYEVRLARWGTELHDRFMLPHFVQQDFFDVIEELNRSGFAFDRSWFAPHYEFRFPLYGGIEANGVELTVRQALEPWHVLGEEGTAGGTARYVDSSVERLQVMATGLTSDRFVVTCNGRPMPLQPTGRNGESVAGVRYRAWQPASALHPTIPVQAPLTFDLVDTWMERSLGGGQYHVSHPGGRSYDRRPVNSYEAESRRLSRFFTIGHTPGRVVVRPAQRSREFPYTLDLRTAPDA